MPKFRMAVTGNLVACFGFAGTMFFVTQHLQLVVGMSPLRAGVCRKTRLRAQEERLRPCADQSSGVR